ncbi:MAG TPA: hypothetical protein VGO86_13290 [Candidatus Dormibacteraeota bacterium]
MIVGVVRASKLRVFAVAVAILAGSQLGHAIAYYTRFGMDAGSRQSQDVHSYLPTLAGGLSAALGVLLMTSLLMIAAARSLAPPAGYRRRGTLRFSDLLPALFTVQLLVFAGQETIESMAGGGHLPSAIELVLWGAIGQLPAAAIAAAVLTWLLTRLESAWTTLVHSARRLLHEPPPPALEPAARREPAPALTLATVCPSAFRKRGPPLCSNQ